MKFVTVRDFRSRPTHVWKELKASDEMVLTSNGKPIALLTSISEESLEPTLHLLRKAKTLASVYSIQTKAQSDGLSKMSLDEINQEIGRVRQGRQ